MANKLDKRYILRFNQSNPDSASSFKMLKNGSKKVETRAATVKYRDIKTGDMIFFVCGKERFRRKVKRATIFKNIPAMLRKYKVTDVRPDTDSVKDLERSYAKYPNYREKLKKFGIIVLEFKK